VAGAGFGGTSSADQYAVVLAAHEMQRAGFLPRAVPAVASSCCPLPDLAGNSGMIFESLGAFVRRLHLGLTRAVRVSVRNPLRKRRVSMMPSASAFITPPCGLDAEASPQPVE